MPSTDSCFRYKTLDADEAEEKFAQRGKILNKWAVMVNKKVKSGVEEEVEEPEEGEKKAKVTRSFTIRYEWIKLYLFARSYFFLRECHGSWENVNFEILWKH